MFIHFTNRHDAEAIIASLVLLTSSVIEDTVYAVAVGGVSVPGVQHSCGAGGGFLTLDGNPDTREVAVMFTTPVAPSYLYPEEVEWDRSTPLPLTEAEIITVAEAEALLDGSAGIAEYGQAA